jgi:hypothetical protein
LSGIGGPLFNDKTQQTEFKWLKNNEIPDKKQQN